MTFIKTFMIISFLAAGLIYSSYSTSSVFAEPMDPNYSPENCKTVTKDGWNHTSCCWQKDGKTQCQTCKTDGKTVTCGPVTTIGFQDGQDGSRPVFPVDKEVSELPLIENSLPTKSGDSVFPNDGGNAIDEQQPNPNSPNDQRVPPGNVGILEQLEDSSDNQNSESGDSASSDNSGFSNDVPQNPSGSKQP